MAPSPNASFPSPVEIVGAAVELNNLGTALLVNGRHDRACSVLEASLQCATLDETTMGVVQALAEETQRTQQQPPQPRIGTENISFAVATAREWVALDNAARLTRADPKNPQIQQQQQPYVPPPSVHSLPIRLDPFAVLGNATSPSQQQQQQQHPTTEPRCSDRELSAIAFNLALSHHLLGRSLLLGPVAAAAAAADPAIVYAHFQVALMHYERSNVHASRMGYAGSLAHVARSLLGNMADIHGNVLGDADYAGELLEEKDAVHELGGTADGGSRGDAGGGWGGDCSLDIWAADLPPGAAPSA